MRRSGTIDRFRQGNDGSVAAIMAIAMVPFLLTVGASIDLSRMVAAKSKLQSAVDIAALAAARSSVEDGVRAFHANNSLPGATVAITTPTTGTYHVEATYTVPLTLLNGRMTDPVIRAKADSEAMGGGPLEVALALDNTGSMANDMAALKTAATNMVEALIRNGASNADFKMSVVPFVAAVNPGKTVLTANSSEALELTGNSAYNGGILRGRWIAPNYGCTPNWGSGGGSDPGTGGSGADIFHLLKPLNRFALELFGVKPAFAADVTTNTKLPLSGVQLANQPTNWDSFHGQFLPNGFVAWTRNQTGVGCDYLANPGTISNLELFNRIPTTTQSGATWGGWKGCVLARAEPYDVNDDAPSSFTTETKYVPYFWPDESDKYDTWVPNYVNNYMVDGILKPGSTTLINADPTGNPNNKTLSQTWGSLDTDAWARSFNVLKYNGFNKANIVETPPNTLGPNRACPDEVLPLTHNKTDILNKINSLSYWNGGGTIISEGLMWGWRTLSPNKPYATAKPYDKANAKVIILMSDGKNEIGGNGPDLTTGSLEWSPMMSEYNAYGYLRDGRFPAMNFASATSYLNARLAAACTNAKAKGIIIYTVLFRETDAAAKSLMQTCASSSDKAWTAATGGDLTTAFANIGQSISKLRLTK